MGAVKQQMMEDAENILNVLAHKLVGGDITEDDALEILSKQMDNLEILGFENEYDAMHAVYDLTNTDVGGRIWEVVQVNQDKSFKFTIMNSENLLRKNQNKKK